MVNIIVNGISRELPMGAAIAEAMGEDFSQPCGGMGRCGKCRVHACGSLSPLSREEKAALSEEDIASGIRLACCARAEGEVTVTTAQTQRLSQIMTGGETRWKAEKPVFEKLGAAVDIGTTTLAARLYSRNGLLATAAAANPQAAYGADVLSRVGSAMNGSARALADRVRSAVAGLLNTMCAEAGRTSQEIDGLVIAGNTAMLHLLCMDDPTPLAAAPFIAKELYGKTVSAASLDLPCAPGAKVYLPRCMSAFVGADITMALLASGICETDQTALLVDIGTNGEMALWRDKKLSCCSTAAGPAFEGANLSQGMQGAPGAIDHAAVENGILKLHTIGDVPAVGLCGSGITDVLSCLLELGVLDETGLLDDGEERYALTDRVFVTQGDVRQVQLAKSAIRAGLETLLAHSGLTYDDLYQLAIAGGFGSYLSLESAAAIGLLPAELVKKSRVLGNAALAGAALLLGNSQLWDESRRLADAAETVDLATDPVFMDEYVENMLF